MAHELAYRQPPGHGTEDTNLIEGRYADSILTNGAHPRRPSPIRLSGKAYDVCTFYTSNSGP